MTEKNIQLFSLAIFKNPNDMDISDFVSELDNGEGQMISSNFTSEGLTIGPSKETITAVVVKNDTNDIYFFNTIMNSEVKRIIISKP